MLNLMKYEFRKSWKMKGFVLCFTAFFELMFLFGVFSMNEDVWSVGVFGLILTTICGLFLIGVYSIHVLSKDINTKQSYMLFMTPNSSYKILGSKVLENCGSVFLSGMFFMALAMADIMILVVKYEDIQGIIDMLGLIITGNREAFTYQTFVMAGLDTVLSWVYLICVGYLAVVICATLLNGNKFNGLLSFIAFIVIAILVDKLHDGLFGVYYVFSSVRLVSNVGFYVVLTAIIYFITAWIMENKLSV
ncbi:hypothetical protein [Pseudobutyrivibrio xylanivorans]|uniref:ABC-2 family transporter protein n=1 Tax=Pseudobutyrivibrio xylanivorans DSM 14809 TaxID=1123012 RepID=A0A1M6DZZ0_PSEXY|nr:hypothetical protein [Pseudobutyrivibrio xylanivorans]SHI78690.1 hypothetical protein SAMN02745725_01100 [Pseudobutyrivibrio xylanivorans DSM 14809]